MARNAGEKRGRGNSDNTDRKTMICEIQFFFQRTGLCMTGVAVPIFRENHQKI